jgi:hypothetical protein
MRALSFSVFKNPFTLISYKKSAIVKCIYEGRLHALVVYSAWMHSYSSSSERPK